MSSNYPIDYSYYYRKDQDPAKGQGSPTAPKTEEPITVPVASKKVSATNPDLKGVTIFDKKSAPATTSPAQTKPQSKDKVKKYDSEQEKPAKKTGESVRERFDRYYAGKYSKGTKEEKRALIDKYIQGYLKKLPGKSQEEIIKIEIADVEKLIHNTDNPEDLEILTSKLNCLNQQNQLIAAKYAINDPQDAKLKSASARGVARAANKCAVESQAAIAQEAINTKDEEAVKIIASTASDFDKINQPKIFTSCKNAEINDESKIAVGKILIDQTPKCARENQPELYKITYDFQFQEVKEYAALNICKLDKDNQVDAIKYTLASGNEDAIKVAASQYNNYDNSVKDEIKSSITTSNYESAKTALAEAETKQESIPSAVQTYTVQEKIANIEEQAKSNPSQVKELVANLPDSEKIALLKSTSNPDIIKAVLGSNPSLAVLRDFGKSLDTKNAVSTEIGNRYFSFIGSEGQTKLLNIASTNGTLSRINENDLNLGLARQKYNELIQEKDTKAC